MTYALCSEWTCIHHDGDGCMLEEVELTTEFTDVPSCADVDYDPEKVRLWKERQRPDERRVITRAELDEFGRMA